MDLEKYVPEEVDSESNEDSFHMTKMVPVYLLQAEKIKWDIIKVQASIKEIIDFTSKKEVESQCNKCDIFTILDSRLKKHKNLLEKINKENILNREKLKKENEELEKKAYYDDLTKLHNRCYMKEKIIGLIKVNLQFSLCLIDLDKFKRVNDDYGHDIGDEVLKTFSSFMENKVNEFNKTNKKDIASKKNGIKVEYKLISRYGGEEFILLSRGDKEKLKDFVKKCLGKFRKIDFVGIYIQGENKGKEEKFNITFSGGIQEYEDDSKEKKDKAYSLLLKQADIAMYEVKDNGRNGVVIYEESM